MSLAAAAHQPLHLLWAQQAVEGIDVTSQFMSFENKVSPAAVLTSRSTSAGLSRLADGVHIPAKVLKHNR
jgi:hypothetical protein